VVARHKNEGALQEGNAQEIQRETTPEGEGGWGWAERWSEKAGMRV